MAPVSSSLLIFVDLSACWRLVACVRFIQAKYGPCPKWRKKVKALRLLVVVVVSLVFSTAASAQTTAVYKLNGIKLTNGWTVTGTITTDGTVGTVTAANFVDWNLKVTQTTDMVWTEKDSNNLNISGVSTDGTKVWVMTSPDGFQDGGTLYFGRAGGFGAIPTNAVVADFTQLSINLGFVGGIAGWQDEMAGLNYVGLNQKNHARYRAAVAVTGQPNVFRVAVPAISPAPLQMTLFGTFTTDGTIGTLLPRNILAWNITARTQDITYYTKANSAVLSASGVTSDGTVMKVDHAGGQFTIGISGRRPTYVTLADFTDPMYPDGFANYYLGNFGVMGDKSPLVGPYAKGFTVGRKQ